MDYEVLEHKGWVEQKGCYPSRIVLLKIDKGGHKEYSTHIQVDATGEPEIGKKYLVHGHYFMDLEEAVKDFKKREVHFLFAFFNTC